MVVHTSLSLLSNLFLKKQDVSFHDPGTLAI